MTDFFMADELFPHKLGVAIVDPPPPYALRPWFTYVGWVWTDRFTFRLSNTGAMKGSGAINPSFGFIVRMAAHRLAGAGSFSSNAYPTWFGNAKGAGAGSLGVDATVPA